MALSRCGDNSKISSSTWTIQAADWRDYTQLNHLEKVCFKAADIWPFWDLMGILTLPGLVRLKAVMEGSMVGFIGGERESTKLTGWITTLAVLPTYRRQGIAQALLAKCEEMLSMPAIRLSVRESNHAAIHLYQVNGYTVVDRWEKYYIGDEDALVFEKRR